jgi:hypothetical protein
LRTQLGWKKLCLSSCDGHSSVRYYIPAAAGGVVPFAIAQEEQASLGEAEENDLTYGTVSNVLDGQDDQDQDVTQPLQILPS